MAQHSLTQILLLLVFLQLKHFIFDGPLQTLAMVKAKSIYGKPLGLLHAAGHGAGSFLVLLVFGIDLQFAAALAALDSVAHYHIDFIKENLVHKMGWNTDDGPFWWALTADQALHHMTYVGLVYLAFTP